MNDYFNHDQNRVDPGVRALDSQINNIGDEIAAGFDKLPTEAQLVEGRARFAVDTGVADAYIVTLPGAPTLTDGLQFTMTAVNASTGASTINVNGLGVKPICNTDGTPMVAGSIPANSKLGLIYDSTADCFMLLSMNADFNGPAVSVSDEGVLLTSRVESINVVGAGVVVTVPTPNNVLITIT